MESLGDTEHPLIGQTLNGRYRVISLIGTGGMSAVYRAEHVQLGRPVALKVLNAEMAAQREAMLRFEREALLSAKIQHPHVVSATDLGRLADGSLYLVLELVAGRSLRDLVNAEGKLAVPRALAIAAQIADALDAAHRTGVVHRDLKPSNVMLLEQDGQADFVKVLDFGLARQQGASVAGEALTRTGRIFGTPEYMAPEQARGEEVDQRADLYALGVILYELLAGQAPFQAPELLALLIKHIHDTPPPLPPEIPEPVSRLVMGLLEKRPDRRPRSAHQVRRALLKLADSERLSLPPSLGLGARRAALHPWLLRVALCAAVVSAGAWWFARPRDASSEPHAGAPASAGSAAEPSEEAAAPPDGGAELALGVQLMATGQSKEGLDALTRALELEPALGESSELIGALRRAIGDPSARDRALELAATRLGAAGADLLFEIWAGTSAKTSATRAARQWLDTPAVRANAGPALLLALEIRAAKSCAAVRALLPRMIEHGDERSLAPLRRYTATSGCGFLGFGDCHKCLRRDDSLDRALAAVAARRGPRFAVR